MCIRDSPYMMEQLDPLGTSVTTACSYSPADKGYGTVSYTHLSR